MKQGQQTSDTYATLTDCRFISIDWYISHSGNKVKILSLYMFLFTVLASISYILFIFIAVLIKCFVKKEDFI